LNASREIIYYNYRYDCKLVKN